MGDKMDELLQGFYNFKNSMEQRMDSLEERMGSMERKMDALEGRMDALEGRMGKQEKLIDGLADMMISRFDKVDRELEELSKRVGSVRRISGENMRDIEDLKEKIS
ncbi:MAG TPA: hypothetical protein VKY40_04680 [Halanaerobiales bacterium]|nr:hypothetical protein [Halanaerobiales bacterium]